MKYPKIIVGKEVEIQGKEVTMLFDEYLDRFLSVDETFEYLMNQYDLIAKVRAGLDQPEIVKAIDEMVKRDRKIDFVESEMLIFAKEPSYWKDNGKMTIVPPKASYKEFDLDKRIWGFTCACCGKKVNGRTQAGYYTLTDRVAYGHDLPDGFVRTCDKDCMMVIAKEIVKDWIHGNHLEILFDIEDVENMNVFGPRRA